MKRFLLRLLGFALVVGVLGFALAPVGVRQYRLWRDAQAMAAYFDAIDAMDDVDCGVLRSMALQYDDALEGDVPADPLGGQARPAAEGTYLDLLDPAGNGVMAVLELPKLGAALPVLHGAERAASGEGVGHLEDSGMPVDGAGNTCVLAARGNGWFSGPFAGLDRLLPGDLFTIRSLRDTLTYEVTRVSTTLSEAMIEEDGNAQACVLMTTAENGRLCVRGTRVQKRDAAPRDDSQAVADWPSRLIFAAPVAAAGMLLIWLAESVRRAARRRRAKRIRL